jgi:EpsI family protein
LAVIAVARLLLEVWLAKTEQADRVLILAASGWLLWRCRRRFSQTAIHPVRMGLPLLALGCLLFVVGWYLHVQVGSRKVILWWLSSSLLAGVAGLVAYQHGWRRLGVIAFPLAFSLFALPMPDIVYQPLQSFLKEATTRSSVWSLSLCGWPIGRDGYVLHLPAGDLGVAEACSGVRSVSALLAVAVLTAHLRRLALPWAVFLFVASVPLIALGNAARVIISGILLQTIGPTATEGLFHELLGIVVVLVGLGLVVGLALLLPRKPPVALTAAPAPSPASRPGGLVPLILLTPALAACLWAETRRPAPPEPFRLADLPQKLGDWQGSDTPIPSEVEEMLSADQVLRRVYRNGIGQEVHVWVLYWASPYRTAEKGEVHHPDICWPRRGWTVAAKGTRTLLPEENGPLTASLRRYELHGREQVILYWAQDGARLLQDTERHEGDGVGTDGHSWIRDLLWRTGGESEARLAILVGADVWSSSDFAEQTLVEFSGRLATDLYRLCPWARIGKE